MQEKDHHCQRRTSDGPFTNTEIAGWGVPMNRDVSARKIYRLRNFVKVEAKTESTIESR